MSPGAVYIYVKLVKELYKEQYVQIMDPEISEKIVSKCWIPVFELPLLDELANAEDEVVQNALWKKKKGIQRGFLSLCFSPVRKTRYCMVCNK